jgi:hypothetical protein
MPKEQPTKRRGGRKSEPPDAPPRSPGGDGGGEDDHQRRVRELHEKVEQALGEGELSEEQREEYRAAIRRVIGRLTPPAVARVHGQIKEIKFYASWQELTAAIRRKYPRATIRGTIKGAFDRDGTLHLDGGGILFGRPVPLEELYAHEITHVIDGTSHDISNSAEWREAWQGEIQDGGYLGPDSARSPREGFGEFGAMLLGSGTPVNRVEEIMPECVQVWRDRGII